MKLAEAAYKLLPGSSPTKKKSKSSGSLFARLTLAHAMPPEAARRHGAAQGVRKAPPSFHHPTKRKG